MNKTGLGREYSILPTVTHMLHVYQGLHVTVSVSVAVARYESFFIEPAVKVSGQYCWDTVDKW